MNDRAPPPYLSRSIAAVERDTGLSKDTLRVWERRYGFPKPDRDASGERVYPIDQVEKLRAVRRLMDVGHRPGKIIGLPIADLQALAAESSNRPSPPAKPGADADVASLDGLQRFIDIVKAHEAEVLRRTLSETQLRLGLERFVTGVVAPVTRMIGDAWARGDIEVYEEHLFTESTQVVLRNAISTIPQPARAPRVLLTTIPQEPHGIGLLMAEAILALEGCRCVSLGVQTPVWDIVLAAEAHKADVVALSFSAVLNPNHVLESLSELSRKLPSKVEIWAGGGAPVLKRRPPTDVKILGDLQDIEPAISRWRAAHPEA